MKKVFLLIMLCAITLGANAQMWMHNAPNTFDGEHKNEAMVSLALGDNIVSDFFIGPALFYRHHFTSRWYVTGATELIAGKEKFGIYAKGGYVLPIKWYNIHLTTKAMYNRYNMSHTNEYCWNASAAAEHSYFDLTVGMSLINYAMYGSNYTEPLTFTFGVAGHIRPRTNPWNVGVFFRNYEEFYYENWNINWGLDVQARINDKMRIYCEFVIRPAGSFNQLATHYETAFHAGLRYAW